MTAVISIDNLKKSFVQKPVLKGLSLTVPEQSVYAFLGNNGAGKSTTIRILAGWLAFEEGDVSILGNTLNRFKPSYKYQVGCLIDSPVLYEHLTPNEFLSIAQRLKNLPKSAIEQALRTVDMSGFANDKIAHFSLGMKQRIALANALLGEPKLLLLDEPSNGLDPQGMSDIRALIKSLPESMGATIFLSSHLLDEVEKTATHLAIIEQGQTKFQGCLNSVLKDEGALNVVCDDIEKAHQLLHRYGFKSTKVDSVSLQVSKIKQSDCIALHNQLVHAGVGIVSSHYSKPTLEQFFDAS